MPDPLQLPITTKPVTRETLARLVQAAMNDDVLLSEEDKAVFERLVAADELAKDYRFANNERRAEALRDRFGISIRTARNDLAKAAELFNSLDAVDARSGARILLSQIDRLLGMCLEAKHKGYIKDAVSMLKLKKEVYADLCKDSQIDPRLLQQNNFFFATGREAAKALNLEGNLSREEVLSMLRRYNLSKSEEERILSDAQIDDGTVLPEPAPDAGAAD